MGERMKRLGLDKLAIEERLALVDVLWDSVSSSSSDDPPLTSEQLAELDRRLDALEAGADRGRPAAEVMAERGIGLAPVANPAHDSTIAYLGFPCSC